MSIKDTVITAVNRMKRRMVSSSEIADAAKAINPDLSTKQVSRAIRDTPMIVKAGKGVRIKGRSVPERS